MPKFFIESNQINNNTIKIKGEDVNHIANVLRKQIGDELNICNSTTSDNFLCKIIEINKENIICDIIERIENKSDNSPNITIFQGLPKADKMELIIQKCTELGVNEFVPLQMERCVVKLDSKNEAKKIERWQKIAETAAKQCGRNNIPKVENLINIKKLCNLLDKYDIVLVAYEQEKENTLKIKLKDIKDKKNINIAVVIGPEGGIEASEIEELKDSGAEIITLGERILRTETVGIAMASIIMYELE